MFRILKITAVVTLGLMAAAPTLAQSTDTPAVTAESEWLQIHFKTGSATISDDQVAMLDHAARTFREGDPFVMIVAGGADTVGSPAINLALSLERATVVANGLQARGIPVDRLQVLGRGNSELKLDTADGVSEAENRIVEISWR